MSSEQKTYLTDHQERAGYRNEKLEEIRNSFNHSPRFIIQRIPETEQVIDLQKLENQELINKELKPFFIKGFDYKPDDIKFIPIEYEQDVKKQLS